MANYNNLLNTINGAIKTNGTGAITGQLLQTILDGMVASLGAKYQYAGVATPSTNPGTPDENVFYLATQAGTYTNFGGLVVNDGEVCALKWDGTWVKEVTGAATAEQVSQLGQEVENPEWVRVVTDSENKILYGVKSDGKFYFGDGCPPQVKEYVQEQIESIGIDALLATKVDKVVGKSLIDSEYASTKSTIDSPEFLDVTLDAEDKILEGLKQDGTKVIGGDINVGGSANINDDIRVLGDMELSGVSYKVVESPEYLAAWMDASDKVIFGLKADGKTYVGDADFLNDIKNNQEAINEIKSTLASIGSTIEFLDIDALSSITTVENPEFIEAKTDSEGKLLAGRTPDGAAFENIGFTTPKVSIDGATIENIDDIEERTEILTDAEGKIISYRDSDGVKHEEVGVSTNKLNLTNEGMSDFQRALKDSGFHGGAGDWSDYISKDGDMPLCLPEPRCAIVNFVVDNLPVAKNVDYKGYIEFSDGLGNYFKKKAVLNGQGSSSIVYNDQKNIAVDLFDSEWDGDAFAVKFGKWVPQDSFHVKTFYMDPIRGLADVVYKYAEEVIEATDTRPNRLAREEEKVSVHSDTGTIENDYNTGALCHPDGFPCLVYHNGTFMGIYAWNLKKHRDNYMMDKKDYESVHIDPDACNLWNLNAINWAGMEIRNPKTLICMDGSKYDGDAPMELIDSTSEYYDSSNKDHKNTVKTKNVIVGLHDKVAAINAAATIEEKKQLFSDTFDVDSFIVFWLISQLIDNWDGLRDRNTQWLYYKKSGKWCPSFYDTDNVFGYGGYPWLNSPTTTLNGHPFYGENLTNTWIWQLFRTEVVAKYNELRQNGLISVDAFMKHYDEWCNRLDSTYIELNAKMWNVPCYRDGKINGEYWKQVGIVGWGEENYNPNTSYTVGDKVNYGAGRYIRGPYVVQFECIKACQGQTPCGLYDVMPQAGGVFDSPRRIKKWLEAKIEILDGIIVNS